MSTPDYKRIPYFLIGCIGSRSILTYTAYKKPKLAQKLAPLAMIPAIGWVYLSTIGQRDTGVEVFGGKIWWQDLRPIHAGLWATFSIQAYNGDQNAYMYLATDTLLGFSAWMYMVAPEFL
jgi:hypothetical protein